MVDAGAGAGARLTGSCSSGCCWTISESRGGGRMYNGDGLFARCIPRGLGERSLGIGLIATGDGKVYAGESCAGTAAGAGWGLAIGSGEGAGGTVWPLREAGIGITGVGEDSEVEAVSLLFSGTGVDSLIAAGADGVGDFTGVDAFSDAYPGPGTADLTWGAA